MTAVAPEQTGSPGRTARQFRQPPRRLYPAVRRAISLRRFQGREYSRGPATDTLCGRLGVRALDHIRRLVSPPSLCRATGAPAISDAHQFGELGQAVDSRVVVGVAVGGGVERECEE